MNIAAGAHGCLVRCVLTPNRMGVGTDEPAVDRDWGTPDERAIRRAGPEALGRLDFASGSMGPKVQAACELAEGTGRMAGIGALSAAGAILEGRAGTIVTTEVNGIELH